MPDETVLTGHGTRILDPISYLGITLLKYRSSNYLHFCTAQIIRWLGSEGTRRLVASKPWKTT